MLLWILLILLLLLLLLFYTPVFLDLLFVECYLRITKHNYGLYKDIEVKTDMKCSKV